MANTNANLNRFEELQHSVCVVLEQNNGKRLTDEIIGLQAMIVRTIRLFWKHPEFVVSFVATETIKKVMTILTQCFDLKTQETAVVKEPKFERVYTFPKSEAAQGFSSSRYVKDPDVVAVAVDKKQISALIDAIVKLLHSVVLEHKTNIAHEVSFFRGAGKVSAFQEFFIFQMMIDKKAANIVIKLINSKYQSKILRMLAQLSDKPIVKEAMTFFNGITLLTEAILNDKTPKSDLYSCVLILSTVTSESVNRLKVRSSGSIRKLVQLALASSDPEEIELVISLGLK